MAPSVTPGTSAQLLVVGDKGGVTVIDPSTPLKRLNYFDGKFLRASDFDVEQDYLRHLVALSNQGLGAGVVYGYDTTLGSGDTLEIGPGLAVDPRGNVLLLQAPVSQSIQDLIDKSRTPAAAATSGGSTATAGTFSDCVSVAAPPPVAVVPVSDIYVIVICTAEALCGQADVFGKLCEEACVTSTDRPYRLDGIVLRAIPLQLVTPFPTSTAVAIGGNAYLRSKVAHAWFADEVRKHPNAVSRSGLLSDVWCLGAQYDGSCCEVPLAVVARAGSATVFLDPWIARRERMDAPARRYWQWTMRMRPADVFLAQVLQFQCQLADLLDGVSTPGDRGAAPDDSQYHALQEAAAFVQQVRSGLASYRSVSPASVLSDRPELLALSLTKVADLQDKLHRVIGAGRLVPARDRILIRGGLFEMSSGGYLPVVNGSDVTVNDQVRALLGEGLDLRFCVTTADYIAHAIEEAQHMDRISLLEGLDDPSRRPHVDILVPDGTLAISTTSKAGLYDASLVFSAQQTGGLAYRGAAREEAQTSGGMALSMGGAGLSQTAIAKFQTLAKAYSSPKASAASRTITPDIETNVFVTQPKTAGAKLDGLVATISSSARMFTAGTVSAATRKRLLASEGRIVATHGTVDGLWLTVKSDLEWRTLDVGDHTAVSVRAVIGSRPASPIAVELTFNGTCSVTGVASGPVLNGTLNGIVAIGMLKEDQADQQTTEYLVTERINVPVTVTYAGDTQSSTIALDLGFAQTSAVGRYHLRFLRTAGSAAAPVTYELFLSGGGATATSVLLGRLRLVPDADVVSPSNQFHQYAEGGLDIVQAALAVSEPNLEAIAEGVLFPAQPAAVEELAITAVRDWVAFVRRRERQCAAVAPPPPPAPPRTYQVIDVTLKNLDEARKMAETTAAGLHDPNAVVQTIQSLLVRQERLQQTKLLVRFTGGKATAESDLTAAESDWTSFNPGKSILYVAVGAVGESDAALQLKRIGTFEAAISADSRESTSTKQDTIIPYPQAAVPANADGVMIFITVDDVVDRTALLIYAVSDNVNGERDHFLDPPIGAGSAVAPSPSSSVVFENNVPQGTALAAFIKGLGTARKVQGVTLATTKSGPDAGAQARLQAVIDALVAAKMPMPATPRQAVQALNTHDRNELLRVGHNPDDVDDVIFIEAN